MKEKCKICGIRETEIPEDMPLGFWLCSQECMAINRQHPEYSPVTKVLESPPNESWYLVAWPEEVDAEGRQGGYQVCVTPDIGLYLCPCGNPAHPEFQPGRPVAAYQRGIDDLHKTACHHIGAVLMLERHFGQETRTA